MKQKGTAKRFLKFSLRERRALLLLIPLMAVLVWILYSAAKPRFDGSAELIGDGLADRAAMSRSGGGSSQSAGEAEAEPVQYYPSEFDPNTVTYEQLRQMGIASNVAASLIRARERGKVFGIPEDFAASWGITDSVYAVFKPYIVIADEFKIKPYGNSRPAAAQNRPPKTVPAAEPGSEAEQESVEIIPEVTELFNPNEYTAEDFTALGFSPRQSEVIIRFRESMGGFRSKEDLERCYVVSEYMYQRIKDFIAIPETEGIADVGKTGLVDINTADSVTLVSVRGIGPKTASEIIAYRQKLGGFHDLAQLADLKVVTEKNYELMCPEIWADSCVIQKIDINFATPKVIGGHPYMTDRTLRKILKNRQLKGGWRTTEEMIEDNTLTKAEAGRLAPYLQFGPLKP